MKQPRISLVVAMARNRVIGRDNQLPWHLPADLKHFKAITIGKPVVMGRKTYESIGRPLPERTNIVVTRDPDYRAEGCLVVNSAEAAIEAAGAVDEVMIIGGGQFYEEMLPRADRLYLTEVHEDVEGDAWFPEFDRGAWRELEREDCQPDERNPHAYSFLVLER